MRLDLPDSFDVAALMAAIHDVADQQGHQVHGGWDKGAAVLTFRPKSRTARERIAALGARVDAALNFELVPSCQQIVWEEASPSLTTIESVELHPNVVPITRKRAHGGGMPPSAA